MKLVTHGLTLCLAFGIAASAMSADTAAESKTVSPDAVLAGLKRTENRVQNFSVRIHSTKYYNAGPTRLDAPVKTQADADYVVEFPKKIACDYTFEQFTIRPDKQVSIYPKRGKLAFDGKVCHVLEGPRNVDAWHGEIWSYAMWNAGPDPSEFTTNYFQQPISSSLEKHGIVLAGRTKWEGRPVIIVETPPIKSKTGPEQRKLSYWIDVERNWLVVRRAILVQYRSDATHPDQKWQEYQRVESRNHTEVWPGVWLPREFMSETLHVSEKQKPPEMAWRDEGEARGWAINRKLPANQFKLDFPPGTPVDDHTVTPQRAYIVPDDKKAEAKTKQKPKRPPIYKEKADAKADIAAALKTARIKNRRVLITWGGNWCGWCYKLHDVFEQDPECAKILQREFVLVLVDIGSNRALYDHYVPKQDQGGFPFLTLLDADGKVLVNQKSDPLEAGPKHDVNKVRAFLQKWSQRPPETESKRST